MHVEVLQGPLDGQARVCCCWKHARDCTHMADSPDMAASQQGLPDWHLGLLQGFMSSMRAAMGQAATMARGVP